MRGSTWQAEEGEGKGGDGDGGGATRDGGGTGGYRTAAAAVRATQRRSVATADRGRRGFAAADSGRRGRREPRSAAFKSVQIERANGQHKWS